jgi:chemotaxis protein MotB
LLVSLGYNTIKRTFNPSDTAVYVLFCKAFEIAGQYSNSLRRKSMKKSIKKMLITAAVASFVLLNGCVTETKYNALEQEYQQLQAEFSADQAQIVLLEGKLKVTMVDQVLFPEGGFRLNSQAKAVLGKLVPTLSGLQQTKIIVDGYTDNVPIGLGLKREGISSNLELSSRRADVVVEYLVNQGVNQNLISAQGFGESNPVASNDTPEGRSQNRRIEVTLDGPGN